MTWTYSASTSNLDQVRLLIGDVCSTAKLVQDETIAQALALEASSPERAAILVCEMQAAKDATNPTSLKVGDLEVSHQRTQEGWLTICKSLRNRRSRYVTPFVGGLRISDKDTRADATDIEQPRFTRDTFSHADGTTST